MQDGTWEEARSGGQRRVGEEGSARRLGARGRTNGIEHEELLWAREGGERSHPWTGEAAQTHRSSDRPSDPPTNHKHNQGHVT